MSHPIGLLVWRDLVTPDREAAVAFYTAALGWTHGDTEATAILRAGDVPIGSITQAARGDDAEGGDAAAALWVAHGLVDDLQRACDRAVAGGGRVLAPPHAYPQGQRVLLEDPEGLRIAACVLAPGAPTPPLPGRGRFAWLDLTSGDVDAALAFYGDVFGWTVAASDHFGAGTYHMLHAGPAPVGGVRGVPPDTDEAPGWLSYVHVVDLDRTHAAALELGAEEVRGPMDIPGVGRFSILADPTSAAFALLERSAG